SPCTRGRMRGWHRPPPPLENGIPRVYGRAGPRIAPDNREIGLGLGIRVERQRQLNSDAPAGSERPLERGLRELDRHSMAAPLRLADDELPAEQLQAFVRREGSRSDQPIVLGAREAPRPDEVRRHDASLSPALCAVNVSEGSMRVAAGGDVDVSAPR